jgi:glucoamylase
MPRPVYEEVQTAVRESRLDVIAQYMLPLMMRNISSAGFRFEDPSDPMKFSEPGAIIASPSYPRNLATINQNYVFNWVRDAAIVAIELAHAELPLVTGGAAGPLRDYVRFARLCQERSNGDYSHAAYTIDGWPRPGWSHQNDGPALQALALLEAFDQLDAPTQEIARDVLRTDVEFVLQHHDKTSHNLWEEVEGHSFFTRSVQMRCLESVQANGVGVPVPNRIDETIDELRKRLDEHWSEETQSFRSVLGAAPPRSGYDPNTDIVSACVYGAVRCADPRVFATAAKLRAQWVDARSPHVYPINTADDQRGLGPLVGRYPGDTYDGNTDPSDPEGARGHPWPLCTANFAELYYRVAGTVLEHDELPYDDMSAQFFDQVGVDADTTIVDAADLLCQAGDRMLQAVVFHSDHFELSEQFDATTGYEKSVRNLTWSYAAFLSAVRARRLGSATQLGD